MGLSQLDVGFINVFLQSVESTFNKAFHCEVTRGQVRVGKTQSPEYEIAVITGVLGRDHTGVIGYSMKEMTAKRLIDYLDPTFNSANESQDAFCEGLGEIINIISGNSMTFFSKNEISLDITTPSVVTGDSFKLFFLNQTTLFSDMLTPFGMMEISIAIKKLK
ncbi:MAG TPA: hypothetical protein ENN17_12640 [bacterium]|nr:hypothetical protein [bacterium]